MVETLLGLPSRSAVPEAHRDLAADDLRIRGKGGILPPAPDRKMLPIGSIGLAGIGRTGGLDVAAGAVGEVLQLGRQAGVRRERGGGRCGDGGGIGLGRRRVVRRRGAFRRVNFAVLIDDSGCPSHFINGR